MSIQIDTMGNWTGVVFLQEDEYYGALVSAGYDASSVLASEWTEEFAQSVADYAAQWDYGTETDDAHTEDGADWGSDDDLYEVTVGNRSYVLAVNPGLGYLSLNRRPLS